jgi:hypothetical protein
VDSETMLLQRIDQFRQAMQAEARAKREEDIQSSGQDGAKESRIRVGDVVMKQREPFERFNKLDEKWSGPFVIKRCFDNGGFEIGGMDGEKFTCNARKLQKMQGTDPEVWGSFEFGSVLPCEQNQRMVLRTTA